MSASELKNIPSKVKREFEENFSIDEELEVTKNIIINFRPQMKILDYYGIGWKYGKPIFKLRTNNTALKRNK